MGGEWTTKAILEWTKDYFRKLGISNARFEAETLLAYSLGVDRLDLYLNPQRVLSKEERANFKELIRKRKEGTPLQYLIGEVEFMGFPLRINEAVLIPRFETEELIERVMADSDGHESSILDLGTGSGAIAIALAHFFPQAKIVAVDLSDEALELAKENATRNGVFERIEFILSDWFEKVEGRFDLIVSNPPYVASSVVGDLPPEVKNEPMIAFDGGERGLREIKRIIEQAPSYLKREGKLYLEIGDNQASEVRRLLASGFDVKVFKDLAGKERIVKATKR
jgi:release factor glutamine methyltransferase